MKSYISLKKVSALSAVFFLFASPAQALTTYTLTGQLYDIIVANETGVTLETPVSLELSWALDGLVPAVGERTLVFMGDVDFSSTYSTLTIGNMEFKETPLPLDGHSTDYPSAHFIDGELVSFVYKYWDVDVDTDGNGTLDAKLSCFVEGDKRLGDTEIAIQIIDETGFNGDEFYGYFDFPVSQPVLDGDAEGDGDVDGIDVASFASAGGDLASLAMNFGQII